MVGWYVPFSHPKVQRLCTQRARFSYELIQPFLCQLEKTIISLSVISTEHKQTVVLGHCCTCAELECSTLGLVSRPN